MATYIMLINWTEQGARAAKDSPSRLDSARAVGKKMGVNIKEFFLTMGACDMVVIGEAPDDETLAKFSLTMAMGGHIRTTTMKAFTEAEYRKVMSGL
jgi:uncharacterized protein with GYD domain